MCGRYFINGDSEAEVRRLIMNGGYPLRQRPGYEWLPETASALYRENVQAFEPETVRRPEDLRPAEMGPVRKSGDIRPSETAPVLVPADGSPAVSAMRWGFISPKGRGLLINARSETALQKPSFSESVLRRRCVIPAAGFYEWDMRKRQYSFFLPDQPVIYMAGCFRRYEDGERFTILTTAANDSMSEIHDRMPLILPERDLGDWLFEDGRTAELLRQGSAVLSRRLTNPEADFYEQLTLPGVF